MDYYRVFRMLLSSFFETISISLHFWLLSQCDVSFKVHRTVGSRQHVMHAGCIMQNVTECSEIPLFFSTTNSRDAIPPPCILKRMLESKEIANPCYTHSSNIMINPVNCGSPWSSSLYSLCVFCRWVTGAAVVNAFYSSSKNQIGSVTRSLAHGCSQNFSWKYTTFL